METIKIRTRQDNDTCHREKRNRQLEEYGSEHGLPIMAGDSLENELQS